MSPSSLLRLHLGVEGGLVPHFFQLLQRGFVIRAQVGCSLKAVLCEQLGLRPDYLHERVQTIFLDGRAVDDPETSIVRDGSTVALSAAMPGLVGATLRRGGSLAAMRSQITYHDAAQSCGNTAGSFTLKLFNLLIDDLGADFLARGIGIPRDNLREFLGRQDEAFWAGCTAVELDGVPAAASTLRAIDWDHAAPILTLSVAAIPE